MRKHWRVLTAVMIATLAQWAAPRELRAETLSQWVQLGADGSSSIRAISDGACPSVWFDGNAVPMRVRSEPAQNFADVKPAHFPVRGCEAKVPAGTVAAMLDGKPLPLARPNPQRIVMFGDTGCRLQTGVPFQACNNTTSWPFPKIAALAAAARPDLVIHVGDYEYRESACPAGDDGCAGSPWGYGWDAWNADFFQPAAPLFAAAPWIMVRGNHEDCDRAAEGWFRFLDQGPMGATCRDLTGAFVARLGGFGVVVFDSGKAADPKKSDPGALEALLRRQLVDVVGKIPDEAWLTTHRPLNAMVAPKSSNSVLQQALGAVMPAGVRMVVSGHIHFFQAVDFGGVRPPQLVVGTGGDTLDSAAATNTAGAEVNGRAVVHSATYAGFGYMVWDRSGETWAGTLFDVDGKIINHCRLADRLLSCGS